MMIEMLDLCKGKQIPSLNVSSEGNMDKEFSSMIRNYKSSFKLITDVSVKEKSDTTMPHKGVAYHHASSKQLIPYVERIKKYIKNPLICQLHVEVGENTIMFFL